MLEVGLNTDRDLSVLTLLKKHDVFYSSDIPDVTWYEPLYNRVIVPVMVQCMSQIDLFDKDFYLIRKVEIMISITFSVFWQDLGV